MTDEDARALLELPVYADGVRIGTVEAVWVDPAGAVLGLELGGVWHSTSHYLPFAAAKVGEGMVRTGSLAVLGAGPTSFFEHHGARRLSASDEAVGFARARNG